MRFAALFVFVLVGCVTVASGQAYSDEEMLVAASALTKVASATEAAARYGNPADDMSDQAFLELATAHDPSLLKPLTKYQIRVLRKDHHAITLLCSADGTVALIEDAGCTGPSDRHHWQSVPVPPCGFTLDPAGVCPSIQ